MAVRRIFSVDVIDTDDFLELPSSAQALYFHLGMRADDNGFVSSPNKIIKNSKLYKWRFAPVNFKRLRDSS